MQHADARLEPGEVVVIIVDEPHAVGVRLHTRVDVRLLRPARAVLDLDNYATEADSLQCRLHLQGTVLG